MVHGSWQGRMDYNVGWMDAKRERVASVEEVEGGEDLGGGGVLWW